MQLEIEVHLKETQWESCSLKERSDGHNVKRKDDFSFRVPILFHSLGGYDIHHIFCFGNS
jgi:hypothetical protein